MTILSCRSHGSSPNADRRTMNEAEDGEGPYRRRIDGTEWMLGPKVEHPALAIDGDAVSVDHVDAALLPLGDEGLEPPGEVVLVGVQPRDPSPVRLRQRLVQGIGLSPVSLGRPHHSIAERPKQVDRVVLRPAVLHDVLGLQAVLQDHRLDAVHDEAAVAVRGCEHAHVDHVRSPTRCRAASPNKMPAATKARSATGRMKMPLATNPAMNRVVNTPPRIKASRRAPGSGMDDQLLVLGPDGEPEGHIQRDADETEIEHPVHQVIVRVDEDVLLRCELTLETEQLL